MSTSVIGGVVAVIIAVLVAVISSSRKKSTKNDDGQIQLNSIQEKYAMKHEKWSCPKCNHKEYDLDEMRVAGSFWTKIFNIQNKQYTSVSCTKCSYTEFFKDQPASGLANVFDFFTN